MQRIPRPLTDADRADRAINLGLAAVGDLGPVPTAAHTARHVQPADLLRYATRGTVLAHLAEQPRPACTSPAPQPRRDAIATDTMATLGDALATQMADADDEPARTPEENEYRAGFYSGMLCGAAWAGLATGLVMAASSLWG